MSSLDTSPLYSQSDDDDDGLLWADLWVNIAFVLFTILMDPQTSWVLPDLQMHTQGRTAEPLRVVTLFVGQKSNGDVLLRLESPDGEILTEDEQIMTLVSSAKSEDPDAAFRIVVSGREPSAVLLDTIAKLERAGASDITLQQTQPEE
jgi:hypothetical protein